MIYKLNKVEYKREWRKKNRDKLLAKNREYQKNRLDTNLNYRLSHLFSGVKSRAKKKNIEFDIELSEIKWPKTCPVLHIPIDYTSRKHSDDSPSFDRVDNSKGYVKDNVQIISLRANQLKNNASLDELKSIVKYIEDHLCQNF